MRNPKWSGVGLNFQFSGIIAVFPGGSIFSSGTKPSRPAEHKVMGTERLLLVGHEVLVRDATHISTLDS